MFLFPRMRRRRELPPELVMMSELLGELPGGAVDDDGGAFPLMAELHEVMAGPDPQVAAMAREVVDALEAIGVGPESSSDEAAAKLSKANRRQFDRVTAAATRYGKASLSSTCRQLGAAGNFMEAAANKGGPGT